MKHRDSIGCACLLSLATATGALAQSNNTPTRVDVRLVNVYVTVTDQRGAPVGGLTKEDFLIAEDGAPQTIAHFEKQADTPLSIVLALDTSGSVKKDLLIEQAAARQFAKSILRPVDGMELVEFNESVRQAVPFTNQLHRIDHGLDSLRGGTATALYEALIYSGGELSQRQGRKIIVLVTDGGDTTKGPSYQQALHSVLGAEAIIYPIIDVPVAADAGRDTGGEHALIQLSDDTGGRYYYAESPQQLSVRFQQLSEDLRSQYLLSYYAPRRPSNDADPNAQADGPGDFRRIHVELKSGPAAPVAAKLRYRTGYFTGEGR